MRRRLVSVAVALGLLAGACGGSEPEAAPRQTAPPGGVLIRFPRATLAAEVVADREGRQRGLMHRETLGPNSGMLFLFPRPQHPRSGFWMKNTLIPLGIAYMKSLGDGTFEVLQLQIMQPCLREDCPTYVSGVAFDSALEVNRGWFRRHRVRVGTKATVEGDLPTPV